MDPSTPWRWPIKTKCQDLNILNIRESLTVRSSQLIAHIYFVVVYGKCISSLRGIFYVRDYQNDKMTEESAVKVCVRVRPLIERWVVRPVEVSS